MDLRQAMNDFVSKNGNYPKYIFATPEFLIKSFNEFGINKYYSIIPIYIDAALKTDFYLSNETLQEAIKSHGSSDLLNERAD